MRSRPWEFKLLSSVFILIALAMPLQIFMIYEHSFAELGMVLSKLTYLNWLVIGLCALNAFYMFNGHKFAMYTMPFSLIIVATNNTLVASFGSDYSFAQAGMATLAYAGLYSLIYTPNCQKLFKSPQLRWWLTPKRYDLKMDMFIKTPQFGTIQTRTFDVSQSGAFIDFENFQRSEFTQGLLQEGDDIIIDLFMNRSPVVTCKATVVRKNTDHNKYPTGLGIQFQDTSKKVKKFLRQYQGEIALPMQ